MKKFISMLLVLCCLGSIPAAIACEENDIPIIKLTEQESEWSCCYMALGDTNGVFGKTSMNQEVEFFAASSATGLYVRGISEDGLIMVKGTLGYILYEETVFGLTKVDCQVDIYETCRPFVRDIVEKKFGYTEDITDSKTMAATLVRTEKDIFHVFFDEKIIHIPVGTVKFRNGITILYAGDFDGDGEYELGFQYGHWFEESKDEPKQNEEQKSESVIYINNYYTSKTCTKIIQVNNQVVIDSNVRNAQIVNGIGGECKKNVRCH